MRIAYFAHSLRSDWNNGNAHFLRGLLRAMRALGHEVFAFEATHAWSIDNLQCEAGGPNAIRDFEAQYPELQVLLYDPSDGGKVDFWRRQLGGMDVVIVHEWNPPTLTQCLLELRRELGYKLLFHDTHHRASSSPEEIHALGVDQFDGVLAFGEALRSIYRDRWGIRRVWTLHEAADTTIFRPIQNGGAIHDVVWIGNWGDDERSDEIHEFILKPSSRLPECRFQIFGVRYPKQALAALRASGVAYGGYLPNLCAPKVYAEARMTLHVPRQQYSHAMAGIPTIRVFEALACGIPLVSAPWNDAEQLFRKKDFLIASDAQEMQCHVQRLLAHPEEAREQAARGLETILARHTCRHRAEQLSTICEEVLQ
jgi:spore maturation protein CgeB